MALGDLARFSSDHQRARKLYREYRIRTSAVGNIIAEMCGLLNLAQLELEVGNFEQARRFLIDAEVLQERSSGQFYDSLFKCAWTALHCATAEWSEADEILKVFAGGWPEHRAVVKDQPWLLELAAGHAEEAGCEDRARSLLNLARDVWTRLGADDAVLRIDDKLK